MSRSSHRYRLRYDDFWSTGIWVGLRIYLIPVTVFLIFLAAKSDADMPTGSSGVMGQMRSTLAGAGVGLPDIPQMPALGGSADAALTGFLDQLGGLSGGSSSGHMLGFGVGSPGAPGAKFISP